MRQHDGRQLMRPGISEVGEKGRGEGVGIAGQDAELEWPAERRLG